MENQAPGSLKIHLQTTDAPLREDAGKGRVDCLGVGGDNVAFSGFLARRWGLWMRK